LVLLVSLNTLQLDEGLIRLFDKLSDHRSEVIRIGEIASRLSQYESVPPFLRSLLVADGTVTMALEAYFLEQIEICTLRQGQVLAPRDVSALDLNKGEQCLIREVQLLGVESSKCYVHAVTVINPSRLSPILFEQLVDEEEGIGAILRNVAKGSFREVIHIGTGGLMTDADIHRRYRVSLNSLPALLITEEFELSSYR
jgi:chorismate-pyruvate lyase